jgi:hypothetical protein
VPSLMFYVVLGVVAMMVWVLIAIHRRLTTSIDFYNTFLVLCHDEHEWHQSLRITIFLRWVVRLGIVAMCVGMFAILRVSLRF